MSEKKFHHSWDGEHAQKFAKSVESMKKTRYIPFAQEIKDFVDKFLGKEKLKILDIGCGPGYLLLEIAKLMPNSQLIGVDLSEDMLHIAMEKFKEKSINSIAFREGPAESIPIDNAHSDVVVCLNSLHDFNDAEETLSEIYRITKKGGIIILKDKNGAYPKWKVVLGFIPLLCRSGLKRTVKYFKSNEIWLDPDEIEKFMEGLGFKIKYLKKKLDYLIVGRK